MTAEDAKAAAAAARNDLSITPADHTRAQELVRIALGAGVTTDESAALIAAKLAQWTRADCFAAAGVMDPCDGRTPRDVIAPLVWYKRDGWEHGGSAISWREWAEELEAKARDATKTLIAVYAEACKSPTGGAFQGIDALFEAWLKR